MGRRGGTDERNRCRAGPLFMNFLISLAPLRSSKSVEEEGARFSKTRIRELKYPEIFLFISISFTEREGRRVVTSCVGFNEPG